GVRPSRAAGGGRCDGGALGASYYYMDDARLHRPTPSPLLGVRAKGGQARARAGRVHRSGAQAAVPGATVGAERCHYRRQDRVEPSVRSGFHPGALVLSSFGSRSNVELSRPRAGTIFPSRIPLPIATDCLISGYANSLGGTLCANRS